MASVVLSADYFSISEEEITHLESVLTIVGRTIVYATNEFSSLALPPYQLVRVGPRSKNTAATTSDDARGARDLAAAMRCAHSQQHNENLRVFGESELWSLGGDCFAL
jgi:hypothetical protein